MARRRAAVAAAPRPITYDFLTVAEVADILGVSRQTLSYWRSRNLGPISERVVGTIRYPREEFEAWLEKERASDRRGEGVA